MYLSCIHWARTLCKYLFEYSDYHVSSVHVNYTADIILEQGEVEKFPQIWKDQSREWVDLDGRYYWDVTGMFRKYGGAFLNNMILTAPPCVRDIVYTVKYYYRNKPYKYVSGELDFVWPPPPGSSVSFKMPIMEAWCLNSDGRRVRSATKKLKKAAGPQGNFHNQDVQVMDVVEYDYPKLEVRTLMKKVVLDETDSVLVI